MLPESFYKDLKHDFISTSIIDIQSKLLVTCYSQFTIEKERESIFQFDLLA